MSVLIVIVKTLSKTKKNLIINGFAILVGEIGIRKKNKMQLSQEEKTMLEKLTGKSYKKITLNDLDKISPGINDDLYIMNAKIIGNILNKW